MDRRRFVVLAAESPLFALVAGCVVKESSTSSKFNNAFDEVFKDLEAIQNSKVSRRPKYTAQILRWSDRVNYGVDVLFRGLKPNETVAISNYLNKPWEVFAEDNDARMVVFGSGTSGKLALYSLGNTSVRVFSEANSTEVPADKLEVLLGELKLHQKHRRDHRTRLIDKKNISV